MTEILFAIGAGSRVVAVSTYCDRPPRATRLPRVGDFLRPSVESILALEPDVVIGVPTPGNQPAVEQLERLGVRVVTVSDRTLADLWHAIRTIGRWAGREAAARTLVEELSRELDAVRDRAAGLPRRRVLLVVGHDPLVAVGSGGYLDELMTIAGGDNVARAGGRWPRLSLEAVIAADPEVILDAAMGSESGGDAGAFWRRLSGLPAVRDGRVRAVRSSALLRPGPRVGEAARELLRWIHGPAAGSGA